MPRDATRRGGYDVGGPDSWFGGHSVLTLQAIQRAWGVPATGVATPLTLLFLGIPGGDPSSSSRARSRCLVVPASRARPHRALNVASPSSGYNTSGVDGWYGGQTVDSMRAFQAAWGLPADGIATSLTLAYLSIWAGDRLFDPPVAETSIVPGWASDLSTVCLERKLAHMGYDVLGPYTPRRRQRRLVPSSPEPRSGVSADGLAGRYMLTYLGIWWPPAALRTHRGVGWGSSGGAWCSASSSG